MTRTSEDAERIDQAIAKLAVAWRIGVDEVVLAAYAETFEDLTVEEIEETCKDAQRWVTENNTMPAAASIRQQAILSRNKEKQAEREKDKQEKVAQRRQEIDHEAAAVNLRKMKLLLAQHGVASGSTRSSERASTGTFARAATGKSGPARGR